MNEAELPVLDCKINAIPGGRNLQELTVGDPFFLNCDGLLKNAFADGKKIMLSSEGSPYDLIFLSKNSTRSDGIDFTVTSYTAGQHKNLQFQITDGETTYQTNPLNWNVKSVLTQESPKEVLPPMGPVQQAYPIWVWGVLAGCLVFIFALLFKGLRRKWQKRLLVKRAVEGDLSEISISPYQEFNKTYRSIIRGLHQKSPEQSLSQLDDAFNRFLLRKLLVPSYNWSHREIMRDIKSSHRKIYESCGSSLNKVLREFQTIKREQLNQKDVEQMMNLSLNIVERVDRLKQKGVNDLR